MIISLISVIVSSTFIVQTPLFWLIFNASVEDSPPTTFTPEGTPSILISTTFSEPSVSGLFVSTGILIVEFLSPTIFISVPFTVILLPVTSIVPKSIVG